MKIFNTPIYNANIYSKVGQLYQADIIYKTLGALKCDTVSFGAMKKSQFDGFDLTTIEKFKAPIEKFRDKEDFNNWCKGEYNKIVDKDYGGRQEETIIQKLYLITLECYKKKNLIIQDF